VNRSQQIGLVLVVIAFTLFVLYRLSG